MPLFAVTMRDHAGAWVQPRVTDVRWSFDEIGCESASFRLTEPDRVSVLPDQPVYISDSSAAIVWTGNLSVPARNRVSGRMVASQVACIGNVDDISRATARTPYSATGAGVTIKDRTGATVATNPATILGSQVVEDLLSRRLSGLAATDSVVTPTTTPLAPVVYEDATLTETILTDMLLADDYVLRWGARGTDGRSLLQYVPWGTAPRYMVPHWPGVDVEEPGGESDLCNRVTVRWQVGSAKKSSTYTADPAVYPDVSTLPPGGREADSIDLGSDGLGSQANADKIGALALSQVSRRPDALTITIPPDTPVVDLFSRTIVPPWRIRSGYIVHATIPGRSVRCIGVEVDAGATRLTLGRQRLTEAALLARLPRPRKK